MPKPLHSAQYQTFVRALRSLRERASVSQDALAQKMGVQQTFISKCETGVRRLDVIELRAWLQALGSDFLTFAAELDDLLEAPERSRSQRVQGKRRQGAR